MTSKANLIMISKADLIMTSKANLIMTSKANLIMTSKANLIISEDGPYNIFQGRPYPNLVKALNSLTRCHQGRFLHFSIYIEPIQFKSIQKTTVSITLSSASIYLYAYIKFESH